MALYVIDGLMGLQRVLIAKSALKDRRQTRFSKASLLVELTCASLLLLACLIMVTPVVFNVAPFISFFCGSLVAVIATLPLVVTELIKVITAVRKKQRIWQEVLKLVLNCFVLLIYLTLAFWMSMLLVLALSGEPYMGN